MIQQGATVGARLEKLRQLWQRVKPYLLGFLVVLVVAGAILALYYVPKMQVPVCPPGQDGLPPKICFDIENEARKTLAYILGGILAIIGIYMAHRRIKALERQVQLGQEQLQVAQEGQITERFTLAIEQLGSDRMEVRLGGIYALERIANDSDRDYGAIIETLTAYVRERAPWKGQSHDASVEESGIDMELIVQGQSVFSWLDPKIKPATDIQAVLTVLGRRKYSYGQGEAEPLDLFNTDLRGANLKQAKFQGVDFRKVHLDGALLINTDLEIANFAESNLKSASFWGANLQNAFLGKAHLEGAILWGTNLRNATLVNANLGGASFVGAILDGAILMGAQLKGVDISCATGLTREQLAEAIIDDKTILPNYLQEQPLKAKGQGGNNEE